MKGSTTSQVFFSNKVIKFKLLGRKSLNAAIFIEEYDLSIDSVKGNPGINTLVDRCLKAVAKKTEIPADLISGIELYITPCPTDTQQQ